MNRDASNRIRHVLEEWLPPVVRDSAAFRWLGRRAFGRFFDRMTEFRHNAARLSDNDYDSLYENYQKVHEGTDNSKACVDQVASDVLPGSWCDVGCGTGDLIRLVRARRSDFNRIVGTDVVPPEENTPGVTYVKSRIEALPFEDQEFDTVTCTHVIEHVLDYRRAIQELRRITKNRLIIIVPQEREYKYTFNPHFNFFPYTHSFLRAMAPLPAQYTCFLIGRDIYYSEARPGT